MIVDWLFSWSWNVFWAIILLTALPDITELLGEDRIKTIMVLAPIMPIVTIILFIWSPLTTGITLLGIALLDKITNP